MSEILILGYKAIKFGKLFCFSLFSCTPGKRWSVMLEFGSRHSIYSAHLRYDKKKSKLKIADIWFISPDGIKYGFSRWGGVPSSMRLLVSIND